MVRHVYFDLTCDVFRGLEVNNFHFYWINCPGLSNYFEIPHRNSEDTRGGAKITPSPTARDVRNIGTPTATWLRRTC